MKCESRESAPTNAETEGLLLTTVGENDLSSENFTAPEEPIDYTETVTDAYFDGDVTEPTSIDEIDDFTESFTDFDEEVASVTEVLTVTDASMDMMTESAINEDFVTESVGDIEAFTESWTEGEVHEEETGTR